MFQPVILCGILIFMPLLAHPNLGSAFVRKSQVAVSALNLMVNPSSVVIKVGDKKAVNLTVVSSDATGGKFCFGQEGFPDSGFVLTFLPQCSTLAVGSFKGSLTVEATAAAAPQNFTATLLAITRNQTAQAPLTVTVVPGIPVWVPWFIIVVFILFLGIAIIVQTRKFSGNIKSILDPTRRRHQSQGKLANCIL